MEDCNNPVCNNELTRFRRLYCSVECKYEHYNKIKRDVRAGQRKIKKFRVNDSMRLQLPKSLKLEVFNRSGLICEDACAEDAVAIHHKVAVRVAPERQWELDNLEHLCIGHHRARHLDLPDFLFKGKQL